MSELNEQLTHQIERLGKSLSSQMSELQKQVYTLQGSMTSRMDGFERDMKGVTKAIYGNGQPGLLQQLTLKADKTEVDNKVKNLWSAVRKDGKFRNRVLTIWATLSVVATIGAWIYVNVLGGRHN